MTLSCASAGGATGEILALQPALELCPGAAVEGEKYLV